VYKQKQINIARAREESEIADCMLQSEDESAEKYRANNKHRFSAEIGIKRVPGSPVYLSLNLSNGNLLSGIRWKRKNVETRFALSVL
jgi:hypothetical protein